MMGWLRSTLERFASRGPDLMGGGERVDIDGRRRMSFDRFDLYQKSHFRRYEFARDWLPAGRRCADLACGTGYGTVILSEKYESVVGVDRNPEVVSEIRRRYHDVAKVAFVNGDLLDLDFRSEFDAIVSFETVEHLTESSIPRLFGIFERALVPGGALIFSVPFLQEEPTEGQDVGFHLTFGIDEKKVDHWLAESGLELSEYRYQNYATHVIEASLEDKDFLICLAHKR